MGMAASQARLLSLTARLSDLELQAMQLTNAKIQLSRTTEKVAKEYTDALNNKKFQIKNTNTPLTANLLIGFQTLPSIEAQRILVDSSNRILVSSSVARAYDVAGGNFETFLNQFGYTGFYSVADNNHSNESEVIDGNHSNESEVIGGDHSIGSEVIGDSHSNNGTETIKGATTETTTNSNTEAGVYNTLSVPTNQPVNSDSTNTTTWGTDNDNIPTDNPTTDKPPVDQPGKPPVDQPGKPPVDQPGKPPVDQPGKPPVDQPGKPPVDQPGKPPVVVPPVDPPVVDPPVKPPVVDPPIVVPPVDPPIVVPPVDPPVIPPPPPTYIYDADAVTYYSNIFNQIQSRGYVTTDDQNLSNSEWLHDQLFNGNLKLEKLTSTGHTQELLWSEDGLFQEVYDTSDDKAAEAKYTLETSRVQAQDKKYDLELKQIETEHKAIVTEVESVKKVIDKNIEFSFKIFG